MTSLASSFTRPRKKFEKIPAAIDIPYLIELQKSSYNSFLQAEVLPNDRKNVGLQSVFNSVFPISHFAETASVEFVSYSFEEPKYTVDECRQRGMSFAAPLKVVIRLVVWDIDKDTSVKSIRDVKEQEVYFGEIPLMTEDGTFIINGTERVVVSQLHRSSGVFFDHDKGRNSTSGKLLYTARVIPYRGSWLDFEFDTKDILYLRIDRRRKMYATILLKALGYTEQELLDYFYKKEWIRIKEGKLEKRLNYEILRGQRALSDLIDPSSGKVLVKRGRRISVGAIRQMEQAGIEYVAMEQEELVGKFVAEPILDKSGEEIVPVNGELDMEALTEIVKAGVSEFSVLFIDNVNADASFRNTLVGDKVDTKDEAILEIYKRMRPGDPPTIEPATALFDNLFFNPDRYDLSAVGRMKLNEKLGLDLPVETRTLTKEDILKTVEYLLALKNDKGQIDDIDNLSNRRVRAVGELLENQYRIGLLRIERAIRERLQLGDVETLLPHDFVNNKPASAVVKEFFGSSQLSQFMDQTNPLSEVTHKRRLSALGPGGLSRERAGFEVRDVHPTHYGRICPIETPEGPNIGLISSLASYAKVNEYGFIETPFRTLADGGEEVKYYSAAEEHTDHVIAQASIIQSNEDLVYARRSGESEIVRADEADLMDVSTSQLVSVAANLIPFLQNDDANRALMGSNMQRQAVPLLKTRAPLVGTGMERIVARDSGATIVAKRDGVVVAVDAERIVVKSEDTSESLTEVGAEVDIYKLEKNKRSNVDTCINQKSIVHKGEKVKKGDIIGDGFATEMGELALGQNVVVAFMPWSGYNFEDSILISERVVKEDLYTSIHIQEFECISRDTKLGQEEITSDIPNVGEDALKNLDDAGIIRIGADVRPNDLLVGKITPKGETQLTPEEKLLRAIFGEKAGDVRDTSLRVPPGVVGTVIGAKIYSREGAIKDSRSQQIEDTEIAKLRKDENDRIAIIKESAAGKIARITSGESLAGDIRGRDGEVIAPSGTLLDTEFLTNLDYVYWESVSVNDAEKSSLLLKVVENLREKINLIRFMTEEQIKKVRKGDELPPGVIKMVKIYVAIKRKLQVGDKMAGRHGNKGVVSRILPEEDMPFLTDGRPVDIVLNPLGVPSRMNVGQILETHLGWAAKGVGERLNTMLEESFPRKEIEDLACNIWKDDKEIEEFVRNCTDDQLKIFVKKYREGVHLANPVFDGAVEDDIERYLELAGLDKDGQSDLYDGRTGNKFDNRVTVGVMYVLKLHHLVDEKIHARSIGPYSLVTQQPLGGKAQFGGQRLGEMEVWAMEAYGAANTLQEFLTVKSDDVLGRTRMYESIVKGQNMMMPGLPESFNVLVKELQSLGLDVNLIRDNEEVGLDGFA
ncbi:DNA-directed RNA polymerase subunit beta [Pseudobacteriovorax antillogorgiicola]|uniref:DNA-directed RNA polymerase subunit beta n=2 Tax=Pseudobacteriovorax antillogorgiicola TaxID=1513793 RepID=A0A1Y6B3R7_9BACT|nr:DNA-directed RNA polymerase subunit beta [Pseudobacteriovorax antillogorgiicola]TCS59491.1 DNA-directed RNA polymerase subunit beta [Pseudobacteriovorax antillogorgiicola]SME87942.1 DNA-directed RNA polymerase subunit beta [Pseudobacteriovorax antillogorgiicola]